LREGTTRNGEMFAGPSSRNLSGVACIGYEASDWLL
jgi:hypothetical protein